MCHFTQFQPYIYNVYRLILLYLSGLIKVNDWCIAMSNVMQMDLPWRSLRVQLAQCSEDGQVDYQSTFHEMKIENKYEVCS